MSETDNAVPTQREILFSFDTLYDELGADLPNARKSRLIGDGSLTGPASQQRATIRSK
jgi:hypothetical protein